MLWRTHVGVKAEKFFINGAPTYADRTYDGSLVEGLLLFGTLPLAGKAERSLARLQDWQRVGIVGVSIPLQVDGPDGYSLFAQDGCLIPDFRDRLDLYLFEADWLRQVVVLRFFSEQLSWWLSGKPAVERAIAGVMHRLEQMGIRNVLLDVGVPALPSKTHPCFGPDQVPLLVEAVRRHPGRFLSTASLAPGQIPSPDLISVSDFVSLTADTSEASALGDMIGAARAVGGGAWHKPIVVSLPSGVDDTRWDQCLRHYVRCTPQHAGDLASEEELGLARVITGK